MHETTVILFILFNLNLFIWGIFIVFISKLIFKCAYLTNESVINDYISLTEYESNDEIGSPGNGKRLLKGVPRIQ